MYANSNDTCTNREDSVVLRLMARDGPRRRRCEMSGALDRLARSSSPPHLAHFVHEVISFSSGCFGLFTCLIC